MVRFIWRGVTVGLDGFPKEGYGKTVVFEREIQQVTGELKSAAEACLLNIRI